MALAVVSASLPLSCCFSGIFFSDAFLSAGCGAQCLLASRWQRNAAQLAARRANRERCTALPANRQSRRTCRERCSTLQQVGEQPCALQAALPPGDHSPAAFLRACSRSNAFSLHAFRHLLSELFEMAAVLVFHESAEQIDLLKEYFPQASSAAQRSIKTAPFSPFHFLNGPVSPPRPPSRISGPSNPPLSTPIPPLLVPVHQNPEAQNSQMRHFPFFCTGALLDVPRFKNSQCTWRLWVERL